MAERFTSEEIVIKPDIHRLSKAVEDYFAGDVHALDDLPVSQPGGDFHQAAWKVMREVPPGDTITYAELARRAGNPKAVRAAGSACARNLIAPIVPCHRIVRTGGTMGGYYYGLTTKEWLLAHERGEA
jgi:methylated-DNA-[protein]-cysteine S-methyltransferase